jgi:hypothetical protein
MNREMSLKHWDKWRDYIASGGKSSWPRDGFESYLDRIDELEHALKKIANYKEVHSDIQGSRGLVAIAEQTLKRKEFKEIKMKRIKLFVPEYDRDHYNSMSEEQLEEYLGHKGGCGPGGFGDFLVPDKLFGVINVVEACKIHDYMYKRERDLEGKKKADRIFLNNMVRIVIAMTAPDEDGFTVKEAEVMHRRKEACLAEARTYYTMVKWFGGPAFWDGKNKQEEYVEIEL